MNPLIPVTWGASGPTSAAACVIARRSANVSLHVLAFFGRNNRMASLPSTTAGEKPAPLLAKALGMDFWSCVQKAGSASLAASRPLSNVTCSAVCPFELEKFGREANTSVWLKRYPRLSIKSCTRSGGARSCACPLGCTEKVSYPPGPMNRFCTRTPVSCAIRSIVFFATSSVTAALASYGKPSNCGNFAA